MHGIVADMSMDSLDCSDSLVLAKLMPQMPCSETEDFFFHDPCPYFSNIFCSAEERKYDKIHHPAASQQSCLGVVIA